MDTRSPGKGRRLGPGLGVLLGVAAFMGSACAGGAREEGSGTASPPPAVAERYDRTEFLLHFQRGRELSRRGARAAAEKELLRALEIAPGEPALHIALGKNFFLGNFFGRAAAEFQRAIDLDTHSLPARLGLIQVQERLGNSDETLRVVEEALEMAPGHPEVLFLRGRLNYRRGNYPGAVEDLQASLRAAPGNAEAFFHLGLAHLKQDRFVQAAEQFRETIRVDPGHLGAQQNLGRALRLQGADRGAEEEEGRFREIRDLQDRKRQILAHRDEAIAAYNAGDFESAVERLQRIVEVRAEDGQAATYLGSAYLALGKFGRAGDFLERGLRLDPQNQFALMELGRLSALRGDYGRAEDLLKQAIQLNPEFPFPHYFLSGLYRSQGRIPESLREMEEFRKLDVPSPKPPNGSFSTERRY